MHKFEHLEVWKLAIEYVDLCYEIADKLPDSERFDLSSQLKRASTSAALNIAEGSTSQTNAEQARFVGIAIRSVIETVACQKLIERRNYLNDCNTLESAYQVSEKLVAKLQAFRVSIMRKVG